MSYNKSCRQMADFKSIFLEAFEPDIQSGKITSICDFGSGESRNFTHLLKKYPNLIYIGIEPSKSHAQRARQALTPFPNAKIYNASGYDPLPEMWGTFGLAISLSVLEHVKQINKFLENSIGAVRAGGLVVHRWDLGHALHPSSIKERLQVWLGDRLPALLPEDKFVRTLLPSHVRRVMESKGVVVEQTTYNQMPSHKDFIKHLDQSDDIEVSLVRELVALESKMSQSLSDMEEVERLKLFPSVALWGRKA